MSARSWMLTARSRCCVVCGSPRSRGHHIIKQQTLRMKCAEQGLDYEQVRWDERNLLALCDRHHVAHHSRMDTISLPTLLAEAPEIVRFARELDLIWWLSREYPVR